MSKKNTAYFLKQYRKIKSKDTSPARLRQTDDILEAIGRVRDQEISTADLKKYDESNAEALENYEYQEELARGDMGSLRTLESVRNQDSKIEAENKITALHNERIHRMNKGMDQFDTSEMDDESFERFQELAGGDTGALKRLENVQRVNKNYSDHTKFKDALYERESKLWARLEKEPDVLDGLSALPKDDRKMFFHMLKGDTGALRRFEGMRDYKEPRELGGSGSNRRGRGPASEDDRDLTEAGKRPKNDLTFQKMKNEVKQASQRPLSERRKGEIKKARKDIKEVFKKRMNEGAEKSLPQKRQEAVRAVRKMRQQEGQSKVRDKNLYAAKDNLRNRRWKLQKTHGQEFSKGLQKHKEDFRDHLKSSKNTVFNSFDDMEQKYGSQYAIGKYKDFVTGKLRKDNKFFRDLDNEINKLSKAEDSLADTRDKLPPKKLGSGLEKTVYDVEGKAVRVPKYGGDNRHNFDIEAQTLQMLESKDMAPETFSVGTETPKKNQIPGTSWKRSYQVQPKMKKDFSDTFNYTNEIRPDLENSITHSPDLPMLPEDLHTGNVMMDAQGKPKIIDAGHFQRLDIDDPWLDPDIADIKPKRISDSFKERFKKFRITSNTAGSFRRKLPAMIPYVGAGLTAYSLLKSDPAQATEFGESERQEMVTELVEPAEVVSGAAGLAGAGAGPAIGIWAALRSPPLGGSLPPSVMKKRMEYNKAHAELKQGENLNERTSNEQSFQ